MNPNEQEDHKKGEGGYWVNPEVLHSLVAKAGPPRPDDPGVCYDPDTKEGQTALKAYQERRAEQFRRADEEWARKYPGVEFRRLSDRLKWRSPLPVDPETT